jgi:hypothetical protein
MIERNGQLLNYIGGQCVSTNGVESLAVENPATGEILVCVPLSTHHDVNQTVKRRRIPSTRGAGQFLQNAFNVSLN